MTSGEKKRIARNVLEFDPGYVMLTIYILGAAMLVLFGWFGNAGAVSVDNTAHQEQQEGREMLTPNEVQQGALLLPGPEAGTFRAAPMLSMDVDITVTGIIARATVKQQFTNDSADWVEALYVFPLPDESAVDHLEMRLNDRVIIGKIEKKEKARQSYEAAKKEGKKASLLTQLRPNIFTTAVANIAPGETLVIQIEYQQVVQRRDEVYSLRFPMVVGPSYTPGTSALSPAASGKAEEGGNKDESSERVPVHTANNVQPPALEELSLVGPDEEQVNPIRLHLNLAAGMELSRIESLYHGIATEKKGKIFCSTPPRSRRARLSG
ncbi:MAG: hypothetical protein D3904_02735 [Candidatus Electrothrix sp. EH2]|nr:hypothetical protein [Candidatus Electrothrix sp. EH2]